MSFRIDFEPVIDHGIIPRTVTLITEYVELESDYEYHAIVTVFDVKDD